MSDQDTIVRKQLYDNIIIQDETGKIIYNAFQSDDPVLRITYSDGSVELVSSGTGKVICPRYNPKELQKIPPCKHCGKDPYND